MRKRALLAEQSDVIRGVAESILRQNGYEVISVSSAEKAREVLQMTRPDIMIVGGDLNGVDGRPLYEKVQADSRTSSIPLLLFRNSDDQSLPFPEEVLISRPFDPREFMERVSVFTGQAHSKTQLTSQGNPVASDLDDEFLDAALGLDRIDVTDSQVMDKTTVGSRKVKKTASEKLVGMDSEEDDRTTSGRVETVTLDDTTSINLKKKQAAPTSGGTGKLEILSDQYGMSDPGALKTAPTGQVHDYEWFLNEMKQSSTEAVSAKPAPPVVKAAPKPSQSGGLDIRTTASHVDPITPHPTSPSAGDKKSAGVDKFITEFKQEIEKFRAEEPESITIDADSTSRPKSGGSFQWQERLEQLSPEEMGLFTKQLAREIAEKVAEKIIAKIDAYKLMILIKNEIMSRSQK